MSDAEETLLSLKMEKHQLEGRVSCVETERGDARFALKKEREVLYRGDAVNFENGKASIGGTRVQHGNRAG